MLYLAVLFLLALSACQVQQVPPPPPMVIKTVRPLDIPRQDATPDPQNRFDNLWQSSLLGPQISARFGKYLDRVDLLYHNQTVQHGLEIEPAGNRLNWYNPDTRTRGIVVPMGQKPMPNGGYCREYQHSIWIGNTEAAAVNVACRMSNGNWELAQ